jgi:hypothetical protein
MPKRTKLEKKQKQILDEENNATNQRNENNEETEETESKEPYEDELKDSIEKLDSKSRETRIEGLKSFTNIVSNNFCEEILNSEKETLIHTLLSISQKTLEEKEIELSCLGVSLMVITFDIEIDNVYEKMKKVLLARGMDESIEPESRKYFLSSLALVEYTLSHEDDIIKIDGHLDEFKAFWSKESTNEIIKISSLHAWNFLLTRISNLEKKKQLNSVKHILIKHLKNQKNSVDFNMEIGETLGLLYEGLYETGKVDKDQDLLLDCLEELRYLSSKQKSKKDKKIQRSAIKDILETVENGSPPPVMKLSIQKEVYEFFRWSDIIQLNNLIERLSGGINHHFINNPYIKEIFF